MYLRYDTLHVQASSIMIVYPADQVALPFVVVPAADNPLCNIIVGRTKLRHRVPCCFEYTPDTMKHGRTATLSDVKPKE